MSRRATIICPECEQPMERRRCRGVEIDRCSACEGAWFDPDEIGAYLQHETLVTRPVRDSTFQTANREAVAQGCPGCGQQELRAGVIRNVRFQRCFACHGLFLRGIDLWELRHGTLEADSPPLEGTGNRRRGRSRPATDGGAGWVLADVALWVAELVLDW